jgi:hypothetical protein
VNVKLIAALAAGLLSAAPAFSATVTLGFEGAGDYSLLGEFYNGGTSETGATGTNYGISFGPDALALANNADFTYYSNAPSPGAVLAPVGISSALNVVAGFTGEASFFYSSAAATTVSIFSGLNGSGSLLGTFNLTANAQTGCSDTSFCHWDFASLNFAGVAQSIQFGTAGNLAGFDNVTVAPVPLPAAFWLLGSSLLGLGGIARRRNV